ncbi:MAG: hypothetical protein DI544_07805 [Sphingomonas taxi]|uniref:Quinohemoprotein amine dehydrogenase subunit beta n=1 Tax=Sphingomonas taxi TaxID=1549858 RepID=A0A2W5P4Y4_9SPHN|nr:MAG: hypothetical protein DI544_07805 [Sphingomonas taxi]
MTILRTAAALCALALPAALHAGTIYMGGYPNVLLLFDEGSGRVTRRIPLATGLPTGLLESPDRKTIYVSTITTGGIETYDVASGRLTDSFSLNTPTTKYRFYSGVTDPAGRFFYTVAERIDKDVDRYRVSKPQYTVVDLRLHKVVRAVDMAAEDDTPGAPYRSSYAMAPDGRFLYVFRDKVIVVATSDLQAVERIDLAKSDTAGFENVNFGGGVEALRTPGQFVSLFNAADPWVHNKVFGVARFDLASRRFSFAPIGPASAMLAGLEITPDGRHGYTVATTGTLGNKRCELWHFDLTADTLVDKAEFPCRSRFQFGMSGDGSKLYIYGASYDIEVYDARTLKLEKTWDIGNDATMAGMVVSQ